MWFQWGRSCLAKFMKTEKSMASIMIIKANWAMHLNRKEFSVPLRIVVIIAMWRRKGGNPTLTQSMDIERMSHIHQLA